MAQKANPDARVIGTSSPARETPGRSQMVYDPAGGARVGKATVARLDYRPQFRGEGAEGRMDGIRTRYTSLPGTKR